MSIARITEVLEDEHQPLTVANSIPVVFANSELRDSQRVIPIVGKIDFLKDHELVVHNPSTSVDLTVKLFNIKKDLGGLDRYSYIISLSIPRAGVESGTFIDTHSIPLSVFLNKGIPNEVSGKLVVSNDQVIGLTGGFTAYIRVDQI